MRARCGGVRYTFGHRSVSLVRRYKVVYSNVSIEQPSSRPQAAYLASPHGRGGKSGALRNPTFDGEGLLRRRKWL